MSMVKFTKLTFNQCASFSPLVSRRSCYASPAVGGFSVDATRLMAMAIMFTFIVSSGSELFGLFA
jgi:hypothetical protein